MEYGLLITRSISIVRRYRYLWLLAILGGADAGGGLSGSTGNPNPASFVRSSGTSPAGAGPSAQQAIQSLQSNVGLIVAIIAIVVVLALAWFLLSCVTTGALVRASAEHDAERPYRFGLAWRAGLGTFWSILGLRLLGLVVGLAILAVIGLLVLLGFLSYTGGHSGTLAAVVAVGLLVVLALVPTAIVVGIVFILATRSIVLEQRGTIAALGRSLNLLGARLGRTLLVWLIQVGLSIGVAAASLLVLVVVVVVLGGLVLAIGLAAGPGAAVVVGAPIGLVVLAGLIALGGLTGAYFSTYWTLAFRRMELDVPPPAMPWPPAGYPPQQSPS